MSLETEIAGLSSKVTSLIDYVTSFKTSSAKAIADAVAAAPAISRTFYVNQLIGDDNALGNSDSPLKTIARAIAATPNGGLADIILVEDYTLAESLVVGGRRVMVRGETENSNTRKLILNEFLVSNGMKRFGGFQANRTGSVDLADMTVSLPDSAGGPSGGARHLLLDDLCWWQQTARLYGGEVLQRCLLFAWHFHREDCWRDFPLSLSERAGLHNSSSP